MPSPLVAATDLIARNTPVRIVDCRWYLGEPDRGRAAFADGHLPGAVYASLDDDLSGPGHLPDPGVHGRLVGLGQLLGHVVGRYRRVQRW